MANPSGIRILVVDDVRSIRRSLEGYLEDFGYTVSSVESAEDAMAFLAANVCDIMIVDLRLPGISGDSLILKIHEMYPNIRFVIHTGSVGYRVSDDLGRIGIRPEHVFLKPISDLKLIVKCIEDITNP